MATILTTFLCFHLFLFTLSSARNPFEIPDDPDYIFMPTDKPPTITKSKTPEPKLETIDPTNNVPKEPVTHVYLQPRPKITKSKTLQTVTRVYSDPIDPINAPREPVTHVYLKPRPKITKSKAPEPKLKSIDDSTNMQRETSKASSSSERNAPRRPLPLSSRRHRCHLQNHHCRLWKRHHPRQTPNGDVDDEAKVIEVALDRNEHWRRYYDSYLRNSRHDHNNNSELMKRIRKFLNSF